MSELEQKIISIKTLASSICEEHNLSFIGFFQNPNKDYERVIVEGLDLTTTPNGSSSSFSINNLSSASEIQSALANLLNPNKIVTSSPKHALTSDLNASLESVLSSDLSGFSNSASSSYILTGTQTLYKTIRIDPHNKVDVKNYLYNCFEEFQQIPCKLLAKAWIKVIEPRKQSKYPYKLAENSKPYWWPPNCIHKEPDHLKKEERINLLINIIRIFKQRKTDLVYTASLVTGLGPVKNCNTKITTANKEDFSKRRMDILEDMFNVVNAESNPNVKTIKVIKPGKKYSSQLYQRNKAVKTPSMTNTNSKNSKNDISVKFPSFTTPPSLKPSTIIKNNNKLLPPPQFSSNNESYNDFMNYLSNRTDPINTTTSYNPFHSPFTTPSVTSAMKYPTPQYTHPNETQQLISFPSQNNAHDHVQLGSENIKSIRAPSSPNRLQTTDSVIDPKFFINSPVPSSNIKDAISSQNNNPKSMERSVSPPLGIFTVNNSVTSSNPLKILNSSKINSLNSRSLETLKNSNNRFLFTTFPLSTSSLVKREKENIKVNDGEETDYE